MNWITILVNSLVLIFLLLTPHLSLNLYPEKSFQQNNQRNDDNVANINNIQVPYVSLDVAVRGSYAYIPDYHHIEYYDLENLEYKGRFRDYYNEIEASYTITQIEIQDNYMYILRERGNNAPNVIFNTAEISSPSAIFVLGNHTFNATNAGTLVNYIHTLKIEDNFVYIGTNWYNTTDSNQSIYLTTIIDISNKSKPIEIGNFIESGIGTDLFVKNDNLFITVIEQRKYNYSDDTYEISGENKLVILDISNKSQPIKIKQKILSYRPISLSIQDNYLYSSYYDSGFEIFDIEDIFNPNLIATSKILSKKIVLENDSAYILEKNRLTILDTTEINNLKKIGEKEVRFRGESGSFIDCIIEDNLVLAVRSVQYYGTFVIFDCANIKKPKIVYPEIDVKSLRYSLLLIIVGYFISPLVLLSIISLTIRKLIQKKKTKTVNNE